MYMYIPQIPQRFDLLERYFSSYEKSLISKQFKAELKRIKVTFISEPAGNICGGPKEFCPNKLLPNQASELTVGNLGGRCKPPNEVLGTEFLGNLEINVS